MSQAIRILLADEHELTRTGIRTVLAAEKGMLLLGEVAYGHEATELCRQLQPDVLLFCVNTYDSTLPETIDAVYRNSSQTKVIILAYSYDDISYQDLVDSGASYLSKDVTSEVLLRTIRNAMNQVVSLSQPVVEQLTDESFDKPQLEIQGELTPRQREVLSLLAEGCSNQEIAARLGIKESTVEQHATNIYRKLGVGSRLEAVLWAKAHSMI